MVEDTTDSEDSDEPNEMQMLMKKVIEKKLGHRTLAKSKEVVEENKEEEEAFKNITGDHANSSRFNYQSEAKKREQTLKGETNLFKSI